MFHALIYNSKNIRRNKKYYAYIFVYFPLCQYMYAVYLDFFTNLEIGVPFKKHAIEERKKFENILWKNCHFSILKNHRNRIDFLRIFLMGNIDVFFFSFDTNSEYFAQFFNFYIQILSSRLQCKIPVDILLINMDWNKTR